jgi:hypothetical protein
MVSFSIISLRVMTVIVLMKLLITRSSWAVIFAKLNNSVVLQ